MGKFYAVRNGRKIGIFNSWEECKNQVDGYSGAVFKSFGKKEDALLYLNGEETKEVSKDVPVWYVDGSYNVKTKEFSFGAVLIENEKVKTFSRKFDDSTLNSMRNVAGEIEGARFAMQYSLDHSFQEIYIYYDYQGIQMWALGDWKTNLEATKNYKSFYDSIKDKLKIHFVKVKGHSGDKYNDMADKLAKDEIF